MMITKLEVENFYSIQDNQVLDLVAPRNAPTKTNHLIETFPGSGERAPKVVAIFGANASGKSNILRSLTFIIWFLKHSFHNLTGDDDLHSFPFLPYIDNEHLSRPTRLKLWFSAPESLRTDTEGFESKYSRHLYELEISNDGKKTVSYESLFFWPSATARKTRIFERFENGKVKVSKRFGLSYGEDFLATILKPNASIISTMAQFNHEFSTEFSNRALLMGSNILVTRRKISDQDIFQNYTDQNELLKQVNQEIRRIDVGIRSLDVSSENGKNTMRLYHDGLNRGMLFELESHGTQQFIRHFPLLTHALTKGGMAIIDELDSSMHPTIMEEILRWFRDPRRNIHNAQLWMSCQSPSLLEDLHKDEVVFCEKDKEGKTEIFSLNDIKSVRRDDNFYRKYMGGQYGALPVIG